MEEETLNEPQEPAPASEEGKPRVERGLPRVVEARYPVAEVRKPPLPRATQGKRGARSATGRNRRSRKKRRTQRSRKVLHPRWGSTLSKLRSNLPLLTGLVLLGSFVGIGLLAPLFYPGDPNSIPTDASVLWSCADPAPPTVSFSPWSWGPHPLGQTAHLGIDVAQSLLLGTRWDLLILAIVVGISVLAGSILGAMAGAMGGWTETLLSPIFDGVLAFPPFIGAAVVLAIAVPAAVPAFRLEAFIIVMVAVLWAPFAQAVRAQARILARQPFVEAARASGARWPRILLRHILPNSAAPVLAQVPATIFSTLFTLGAYQYLGLIANGNPRCGSHPATNPPGIYLFLPSYRFPEWTWTLANGIFGYFPPGLGPDDWWAYLIPSAWIVLFLLAVTLVCDGLVGHLDPYLRH